MLAIRPDLVEMDRAVREFREVIPGMRGADGTSKVAMGGKMTTAHGVDGDATLATVEKGRAVLDAMARDVLTFLEHFVAWDKRAPG